MTKIIELSTELTQEIHGLHPTIKTTIKIKEDDDDTTTLGLTVTKEEKNCWIGLVYEMLPVEIILDGYQIKTLYEEGRLVENTIACGKRNKQDIYIWGNKDLEAPASILDPSLLGGLIVPIPQCHHYQPRLFSESNYSVSVPMHLRYLPPIPIHNHNHNPIISIAKRKVFVRPPSLFKFCNQTQTDRLINDANPTKIITNLTDMIDPNVSTLHRLNVTINPVNPDPIVLEVPVGLQDHQFFVEVFTTISIWIAFFAILVSLSNDYYLQKSLRPIRLFKNS